MSLSPALLAHLRNPANIQYIVVLVRVGNFNGYATELLATRDYYDAVNDRQWHGVIDSDVVLESALGSTRSAGDCYVTAHEWYRNDASYYDGTACVIYIGDTRWAFSAFEVLASPLLRSLQTMDDGYWRLEFTEVVVSLKAAMTSPMIPDGSPDAINTPIGFGRVRNAEPVLIDAVNFIYAIGFNVPTSGLVIRDRGVMLASNQWQWHTALGGATNTVFRLLYTPAGTITVDFDTPTALSLPAVLGYVTAYAGNWVANPSAALIGFAAEFIKTDIQPTVWVSKPHEMSGQTLLDEFLEQCEIYQRTTSAGALEFVYLDYTNINVLPIALTVSQDDILGGSLKVLGYESAHQRITHRHNRNQTVQSDFATSVALADRRKWGQEYFDSTSIYTNASENDLFASDLVIETSLWSASRELQRRANKHAKQRRRWSVSVHSGLALMVCEGDVVKVIDPLVEYVEVWGALYFVERVSHNYTTLITDLELIGAN